MAYHEINLFLVQIPFEFNVYVIYISSKEIGTKLRKSSTVIIPQLVKNLLKQKKCYVGWNFKRDGFIFCLKENVDSIKRRIKGLDFLIEPFDLVKHAEPFSTVVNDIFEETLSQKYVVLPGRYRAFDRERRVDLPSSVSWLVSSYRGFKHGTFPLRTSDSVGIHVACALSIDHWNRIEPNVSLEEVFRSLEAKVDIKNWFLNWNVIEWCPIRCELYYSGTCPLGLKGFGNLREIVEILAPTDGNKYESHFSEVVRTLQSCKDLLNKIDMSSKPHIVLTRRDDVTEALFSSVLSIEPRPETVDQINALRLGKVLPKSERLTWIQMRESFLLDEHGLDKAGSHKRRIAIYAIRDDLTLKKALPLKLFSLNLEVAPEMLRAVVVPQ